MNPQSIECDCGCWNIVVKVVPPGETCPCGDPKPHDGCRAYPKKRPCDGSSLEEPAAAKYNVFQFERCRDCRMIHPSSTTPVYCPGQWKQRTVGRSSSCHSLSPITSRRASGPNTQPTPPKPKPPKHILYKVGKTTKPCDQGKPAICSIGYDATLKRLAAGGKIKIPKNFPRGCKMAVGLGGIGSCGAKKPEVIIPHGGCKEWTGSGPPPGLNYFPPGRCPKQISVPISWCQPSD